MSHTGAKPADAAVLVSLGRRFWCRRGLAIITSAGSRTSHEDWRKGRMGEEMRKVRQALEKTREETEEPGEESEEVTEEK
jgi:hypothetical protein